MEANNWKHKGEKTCNSPNDVSVLTSLSAGFLAAIADVSSPDSEHIRLLDAELTEARSLLQDIIPQQQQQQEDEAVLPVGIAFVTGHQSVTPSAFRASVIPVLARHRPAAVWLFAPHDDTNPHAGIVSALKEELASPPRVFVQVGNVAAAREACRHGADVLVCQGVAAALALGKPCLIFFFSFLLWIRPPSLLFVSSRTTG